MSTEFTPTADQARSFYTDGRVKHGPIWSRAEADAEFNRFLAQVRAEAKAEGLREAADVWGDGTEGFPYPWLHERADQIEKEARRG